MAGAAVGGPYFGRVEEVSSNDATAYLPESADATRVQEALGDFSDSNAIPAVVVIAGEERLDAADLAAIQQRLDAVEGIEGVGEGLSPAIPSEDGLAVQAFVPVNGDADIRV